jgi:hypothetical protein
MKKNNLLPTETLHTKKPLLKAASLFCAQSDLQKLQIAHLAPSLDQTTGIQE